MRKNGMFHANFETAGPGVRRLFLPAHPITVYGQRTLGLLRPGDRVGRTRATPSVLSFRPLKGAGERRNPG
jgi:hypothetical protein